MKKSTYCPASILLVFTTLMIVPPIQAATNAVPAAIAGHWEGNARIIVSWCCQRDLPIVLDIHENGSVSGRVGDATLIDGRFTRNRSWLGRKLHLASDYIIRGKLEGPVVAVEDITRSGVSIILDFSNGKFVGGIHTSGSKFGGKEKMILSATDLTLTKYE